MEQSLASAIADRATDEVVEALTRYRRGLGINDSPLVSYEDTNTPDVLRSRSNQVGDSARRNRDREREREGLRRNERLINVFFMFTELQGLDGIDVVGHQGIGSSQTAGTRFTNGKLLMRLWQ